MTKRMTKKVMEVQLILTIFKKSVSVRKFRQSLNQSVKNNEREITTMYYYDIFKTRI